MNASAFALIALLPANLAPPLATGQALAIALCNGGSIALPLDKAGSDEEPACPVKGCHAGACRKPSDRAQGRADPALP